MGDNGGDQGGPASFEDLLGTHRTLHCPCQFRGSAGFAHDTMVAKRLPALACVNNSDSLMQRPLPLVTY